jgi:hypothetical protein
MKFKHLIPMQENKMTVYVQYIGQGMQFEFCLLHKNEYGFDKVYTNLLSKFIDT